MNSQPPSETSGFTLIELVVVLAIMTTAYSLVGPSIIKSLDKVKAQSEVKELKEILKKISYKAFVNGREVQVNFSGKSIQYSYKVLQSENLPLRLNKKSFEQLTFPPQTLNYTSAGFTDLSDLNINMLGVIQKVSLLEVNSL